MPALQIWHFCKDETSSPTLQARGIGTKVGVCKSLIVECGTEVSVNDGGGTKVGVCKSLIVECGTEVSVNDGGGTKERKGGGIMGFSVVCALHDFDSFVLDCFSDGVEVRAFGIKAFHQHAGTQVHDIRFVLFERL